jgi:hypothetical protein
MNFLKSIREQSERGSVYYTACGSALVVALLPFAGAAFFFVSKGAFLYLAFALLPVPFAALAARSCFRVARRKRDEERA